MLGATGLSSHVIASELNIYLWEDTISPRIIDAWNQTHDIKLNFYHFDNDDERSLLMLSSEQIPFDVVILDNVSAQIFSHQETFENLSTFTPNQHNGAMWQQACGTHSVPYFWGYVGIAYRKSKVTKPPTKWRELVDIDETMKGHVGLIQDSVETFLPALYSLNFSPLTASVEELKQAYQKLETATPDVLTYEYALSYVRSHSNSDNLYMSLSYSGDQFSLNRYFDNDDWAFALPEGEPYIWVDCLAVNHYSPNKQQAKLFLEFLMQPEIAAINAQDIKAATPNASAMVFMPDSYIKDKTIFLSDDLLTHSIIDSQLSSSNLSQRAKIINSLIKQHEAKP
ncbi:polyamine ABC transporter substrate-binding protein [Vibrio ziniensis]|uniref:Spermidine/putrescine ABC transporter substrate-binding protein n=1 Tax=Vibrio ziniensis TaxID=2711221 RepID=A0A6G7CG54_9VIBR|nr:spermidine/putrescine ABC transporter substrate-binding protein [Vibrio ziniensis]QIH41018.1 spermidine/putrescine ABC transporter substrate-binding protein [Vibrio ziniensis]